ncbi:MAG: hypothetical protein FJY10_11950 [Bacteroidetes bacterium]|nr:hypothetical protein [Bacteroidota bacterium]
MKEKDGKIDFKKQQLILYVEKEGGEYGPMQTGSYITKNFLDDYELKRRNLEASLRDRVIRGEISMVKYFMVLEDLSESELAKRVRLSAGKVRKHCSVKGFATARVEHLSRYADVFNVPAANFFQFLAKEVDGKEQPVFIQGIEAETPSVKQSRTSNDVVVITQV